MVLTRSRANSMNRSASTTATSADVASPPLPRQDYSPPGAAAATLEGMHEPSYGATTTVAAPPAAAAGSVTLTNEQFEFLISRLTRDPVSTTPYSGNFAKCTARFDGEKSSDVRTFIDAITTYKECVGMEEGIALRGLPILLTGLAATWWLGVKSTVHSWAQAVELLQQTFGPRLPPYKLYRQIFSREQGNNESTDVFVCNLRALFAQLPPRSLSEEVQLDMVYGLLHQRIREKVPRTMFCTFGELLSETRRVEDLVDEIRPTVSISRPSSSSTSATHPDLPPLTESKRRPHCAYCKQYGHLKEDCRRLATRQHSTDTSDRSQRPGPKPGPSSALTSPPISCFGCGTPGVVRSKCAKCSSSVPKSVKSETVFQSIDVTKGLDSRMRPVIDIKVFGEIGQVLVDTGAKHSIGSKSLRNHLTNNGQCFESILVELKFADGRICTNYVDVATVNVTVLNIVLPVKFVMLPDATESLLGMNFIKDIGMILDFNEGTYSIRNVRTIFPMIFEKNTTSQQVCSSSLGLREDEGTNLGPGDRSRLSELLSVNEDIFKPGGGPTSLAVHRIDTGNALPISGPPYRVSPAKKEIIRAEIDKMLELEIIEEAESEWASPVVLVPKKNGETRFCVDYRKLNAVTRTDKYPLPLIDDILATAKSNCVMSTIDLKAGYWQVEVAPADKNRRTGPIYNEGDLVLIESHRLSQAAKGFTSKFAPRREGPYRISKVVSPTTYEIVDRDSNPRGKYHASLLTPYVGDSNTAIVHGRKRGRPRRKVPVAKPSSMSSDGLEGEDIARDVLLRTRSAVSPVTATSPLRRSPRLRTPRS
ncbi:uncharacterized protein LOC114358696 isoform X2 [Ostrinia furnacalis]|uniref:uncharacterized protein LOC114358696 isoform X1 n=1 Tax=Ostrinia furnacalis TaxID=93504 RepID=UPI001039E88E|nr:uncharacterized protein LOC114358696 isoform X1 [Ostrinia furnacalis]XP_028168527.1 uncharacterized protein LOC114358696 isoform X2 [Ostrinia furnacalis]